MSHCNYNRKLGITTTIYGHIKIKCEKVFYIIIIYHNHYPAIKVLVATTDSNYYRTRKSSNAAFTQKLNSPSSRRYET